MSFPVDADTLNEFMYDAMSYARRKVKRAHSEVDAYEVLSSCVDDAIAAVDLVEACALPDSRPTVLALAAVSRANALANLRKALVTARLLELGYSCAELKRFRAVS